MTTETNPIIENCRDCIAHHFNVARDDCILLTKGNYFTDHVWSYKGLVLGEYTDIFKLPSDYITKNLTKSEEVKINWQNITWI